MHKVVYPSHSKHNYYAKQIISAYVLKKGPVPLNPFMNWGYFLDDMVDRDLVRKANTRLIELSNEIWQFGEISNGCYHELLLGMKRSIPIKFFTIGGQIDMIKPIGDLNDLIFEQELADEIDIEEFRQRLKEYQSSKSTSISD